jgi:hypothetical protein
MFVINVGLATECLAIRLMKGSYGALVTASPLELDRDLNA